jgi:hypothetical protein
VHILRQTALKIKPNAIVLDLLADAVNSGGQRRGEDSRGVFVFSTVRELFNTLVASERESLLDTCASRDAATAPAASRDPARQRMQ